MDSTPDPLDVAGLEKALNDASAKINGLWISFCLFLTYLAIAIGSVSHKQLFFNSPVQMPVLSVTLPLIGFFAIAPALILLFHFNILAQVSAFAQKARAYETALTDKVRLAADRRLLRQRIDLSMLAQAFSRPDYTTNRAPVLIARIAILSTIVIAPIALLLLTQLIFLPYQSEPVTWTHRVVLLTDLVVTFLLWPVAFGSRAPGSKLSVAKYFFGLIAVLTALFSLLVAVAPEESVYPIVKNNLTTAIFERNEGEVEALSIPVFSNRLFLQNEVLVDPIKTSGTENSVSLNGRYFRHIQLRGSDLRKADFRGSDLSYADLSFAYLTPHSPDDALIFATPVPIQI